MKIVVLDGFGANPGDLSWEPFGVYGQLTVYPRTQPSEVLDHVGDAEIVLTNKTVLDADTLAQMKHTRYVGVIATGYNVVDIEAAARLGIVVTNIPAYSTDSVAQMTFAHILNITNRVDRYACLNREGRWSSNADFCYLDVPQTEISGKTIGIVGLGSIGMKVACIAMNFGMDVFAYTSKNATDLPAGIQKTTLSGLLGASDIVSLHCPLTEQTRGLIDSKAISGMRRGAILINTARGPLVVEQDVADALESGQLGAYGADVMCQEPPAADNPLLRQPNAFLTPHIAWATREARERLMHIAVDNVRAFVEGHPVNIVNGL